MLAVCTAGTAPVYANSEARQRVAPLYKQLHARAAQLGTIRVIARYKTQNPLPASPQRLIARQRLQAFLSGMGISRIRELRRLPLEVYQVDVGQLDQLLDSGLFETVIEDKLNAPAVKDSVPYIGGDIAHNFGFTGNGTAIAIIDTGVDTGHPVFGNRVVEEACFSTTYAPFASTTLCPNGLDSQTGPGAAAPCDSLCDHGTHVASIAAGSEADRPGVAPDANLITIQAFSHFSRDDECGTNKSPCILAYDSDLLAALDYVASLTSFYNIAAVNLSLAGGKYTTACTSSPFTGSFDDLRAAGVLPVAASGNNSYNNGMGSPACSPSAMSVGSVRDGTDVVDSWSNSADFLDILAPGRAIRAAIPGGGYANKSGTSMAAPHVTGAAALIRGAAPALSTAQMQALMTTEAVTIVDGRNNLSFPRLDLGMVTAALAGPGELPSVAISAPVTDAVFAVDEGPVTLTASASDPQDGDISASITWQSDLDGSIASPAMLSAGRHVLQAFAYDSVGFSATDSITVTIVNKPTLEILAPLAGTEILQGTQLQLSGSASDVEDGDLSANITWTSSLDGTIASGATAAVTLSVGAHILSASVTDSDGYSPSLIAQVAVTILPDHDGDGIPSNIDNCPLTANPDQIDNNGDGIGDMCENAGGC